MGFAVGIVDKLLGLPHWWTLPGGSITAGFIAGFGYPDKHLPRWYRIIIGICAGFLGWLISLFVAQALGGKHDHTTNTALHRSLHSRCTYALWPIRCTLCAIPD